jgi:hypothetical protein
MKFLFILSCLVGMLGCAVDQDSSMYITGTEELAVRTADGEYVCEAPKKVLICHIPPGNPDNAHTICVSTHAVAPHQEQHGDTIGACEGDGGGGGGGGDDGGGGGEDGVDGGIAEPSSDAGPIN